MIGMVTREMFFDGRKVLRAVDAAARKVLSRFGAFVRTTARHSIRRRRAVSRPGEPPSSHAGHLRRLIFFGYDAGRRSVVIGPTPFRGPAEVPPLLEYGGKARRRGRKGRMVMATYKARPYMGPAFESEKPKLPVMWNSTYSA